MQFNKAWDWDMYDVDNEDELVYMILNFCIDTACWISRQDPSMITQLKLDWYGWRGLTTSAYKY